MTTPPFDLLRVLITVAESNSLAEAATKSGISQPAVSVKLRQLEEALRLPLFFTRGRRKKLTPQGQSLYEIAKGQNDSLQRKLEAFTQTWGDAKSVTIRVGSRPDIFRKVSDLFFEFEGSIRHRSLSSARAAKALIDGHVDFAITHILPDAHDVLAKKLFVSKPQLAVHKRWKGKTPAAIATAVPCLYFEKHEDLLRKWTKQIGVPFENRHTKFVCEDWATLVSAVENGVGYAIIPDHLPLRSPEVITITVKIPAEEYAYFLLYRRETGRLPLFKKLLESFAAQRASSG